MSVVERIIASIHDYTRLHGCPPKRITVSQDVARELDAAMAARKGDLGLEPIGTPLKLASEGSYVTLLGVLVVADLPADCIVDVR